MAIIKTRQVKTFIISVYPTKKKLDDAINNTIMEFYHSTRIEPKIEFKSKYIAVTGYKDLPVD